VIWEHRSSVGFLDVAKFTTLTPLSLLASCKLSFSIVGFKMASLLTLEILSMYGLNPERRVFDQICIKLTAVTALDDQYIVLMPFL
jgi:hypothetical protein